MFVRAPSYRCRGWVQPPYCQKPRVKILLLPAVTFGQVDQVSSLRFLIPRFYRWLRKKKKPSAIDEPMTPLRNKLSVRHDTLPPPRARAREHCQEKTRAKISVALI